MDETNISKQLNWNPFVIHTSATILDALKKIDSNQKGFLIVLDTS